MGDPLPVRLQLSRRKGFDLQAWSREVNGLAAVNCARPGKHGNAFRVGEDHSEFMASAEQATAAQCVSLFRAFAEALRQVDPKGFEEYVAPLRGNNLACWCGLCARHATTGKPLDEPCADCAPCHVDPLGEIANTPICEAV